MYKIIGADGKQYGPVTADEVRQWVATGRANAASLVQIEGMTDWKALSSFPEFSGAALPLPPPATSSTADVNAMAAEITARDYSIDFGACFSRAWALVTQNFWFTVGATFVISVIHAAIGAIPLIGPVGSLLFNFVLLGGLDWMFLKLVRGERTEFGDVFSGFKLSFQSLMLGGLVSGLLVAIGFVLCIAPGIYLTVSWLLFAPLLIMERRLDFWPALELSRKVVGKHWWQLFGLLLLAALVALAGLLACGIGVFVTIPIATAAIVYAYNDIFGGAAVSRAEQPVPAPIPNP